MQLIYRFHAKVERPLRLSGWSYRKNFNFTKHEDIILNSMGQTRGEWNSIVLSRADI